MATWNTAAKTFAHRWWHFVLEAESGQITQRSQILLLVVPVLLCSWVRLHQLGQRQWSCFYWTHNLRHFHSKMDNAGVLTFIAWKSQNDFKSWHSALLVNRVRISLLPLVFIALSHISETWTLCLLFPPQKFKDSFVSLRNKQHKAVPQAKPLLWSLRSLTVYAPRS